jgi:hypothetical protein
MFANNKTCVETVKLADFFFLELPYTNILIGDVLLRRRFVTETFCSGDVLLQETFCYRRRFVTGDVLLQETFC